MLLRTIALTVALLCMFTYANAVEIKPYGAFNYKWSHDENSSGVAYDKLENNGSNIGIDISEPSLEGSTIGAVADGIDEYEVTLSHTVMGTDVSIGYADDVANDISYWGAGASTSVGDISIGSSYTVYDAATDKVGMEATIGWKAITVGYGDKEGTGTYMTYGLSHNMTDSLTVYAEMQQDDLDTGADLQHYSVGTKFTF